ALSTAASVGGSPQRRPQRRCRGSSLPAHLGDWTGSGNVGLWWTRSKSPAPASRCRGGLVMIRSLVRFRQAAPPPPRATGRGVFAGQADTIGRLSRRGIDGGGPGSRVSRAGV